jgi:hypothetical protein
VSNNLDKRKIPPKSTAMSTRRKTDVFKCKECGGSLGHLRYCKKRKRLEEQEESNATR